MTILNELRASGGTDALIDVLHFSCDAWVNDVVLCNGYQDLQITTEYGINLTAVATDMQLSLPTKDATGSQKLRFALGNIRGEVSRLARRAISDSQGIRLIYRSYMSSDLSAPAENPLHMTVTAVTEQAGTVDITAGFFDLIDTQFPRDIYDSEFAPGLKYLD